MGKSRKFENGGMDQGEKQPLIDIFSVKTFIFFPALSELDRFAKLFIRY
jgi:hypothetical protein